KRVTGAVDNSRKGKLVIRLPLAAGAVRGRPFARFEGALFGRSARAGAHHWLPTNWEVVERVRTQAAFPNADELSQIRAFRGSHRQALLAKPAERQPSSMPPLGYSV